MIVKILPNIIVFFFLPCLAWAEYSEEDTLNLFYAWQAPSTSMDFKPFTFTEDDTGIRPKEINIQKHGKQDEAIKVDLKKDFPKSTLKEGHTF